MSIEKMLKDYSDKVNIKLEQLLPKSDAFGISDIADAMRYSLLSGGKRIRPAITMEFCSVCGEKPDKAMLLACAIEMIHTYSLIHDDLPCMDDDNMRRGKPSCHIEYGEATALLAGDGLLTLSFETAALSNLPADAIVRAISILSGFAGYKGMIGGQMIDLKSEGMDIDINILNDMILGKTCALFRACAALGCIAGSADAIQCQAADDYAKYLGLTFQIVDDILDVTGDPDKLGKHTGKDAEQEKSNYVTVYGIDKAKKTAELYNIKAKDALKIFNGDTSKLLDLADYLLKRSM